MVVDLTITEVCLGTLAVFSLVSPMLDWSAVRKGFFRGAWCKLPEMTVVEVAMKSKDLKQLYV